MDQHLPGGLPSLCLRAPLPCLWWWKWDSTSFVSERRAHLRLHRAAHQKVTTQPGGEGRDGSGRVRVHSYADLVSYGHNDTGGHCTQRHTHVAHNNTVRVRYCILESDQSMSAQSCLRSTYTNPLKADFEEMRGECTNPYVTQMWPSLCKQTRWRISCISSSPQTLSISGGVGC